MKLAKEGLNEEGYWSGETGASGVLCIAESTGRMCLTWRSKYVNGGDCFGIPGGAIKDGKKPEESAYLELREEVGYDGEISMVPAYVFEDGDFKYFNFLGIVPNEFSFNPQEDHAWETDYIEWMSLGEIEEAMQLNPGDFHEGLIALFENSWGLIVSTIRKRSSEDEKDLNRVLATIHFKTIPEYPPSLLRVLREKLSDISKFTSISTESALEMQSELGGVVMGYLKSDNPEAVLGAEGHDFLVVNDRYLVDAWSAAHGHGREIYDLSNEQDLAESEKLYGPQTSWTVLASGKTASHKVTPLQDPPNYVEETNGWALFPDERELDPNTPLVL